MTFKVGDRVKLLPHWNDTGPESDEQMGVYTISEIVPNFAWGFDNALATKIGFAETENIWAEEHEIRHLTPLEELL